MNKSVLALAVLGAFAGVASAQSSVTLYGRAEANITRSTPGNDVNNGESVWRMDDGGATSGIGGSRWGLRGTEDLGNGLKAYFVLESGFSLDSGAGSADGIFNRNAYVALGSKSLGDVRLGRQETLTRLQNGGYNDASGIGELKIDESVTAVGAGPGGANLTLPIFQTFGQRVSNAVGYVSPSFGGFQVSGLVGLGEGPTRARHQGVQASFKSGPVAAAVTYEMYDGFGDTYNKVWTIGGNYNFGVATLFAAYQNTSDFGSATGGPSAVVEDHTAYNVGVMVPVGNLSIRAQYTHADYDFVGGGEADGAKYGISARYALSKRTTLYSAVTQRTGSDDLDDLFTVKREITLLGLAHTF